MHRVRLDASAKAVALVDILLKPKPQQERLVHVHRLCSKLSAEISTETAKDVPAVIANEPAVSAEKPAERADNIP